MAMGVDRDKGRLNFKFESAYAGVAVRTQCEFAVASYEMIVGKQGGVEQFLRSFRDPANAKLMFSQLTEPAHIPYDQQATFAATWWSNNSDVYRKLWSKDRFTYEAVMDANNIYSSWYAERNLARPGSRGKDEASAIEQFVEYDLGLLSVRK